MTFEEFIEEWKSDADYIEARTSGSTGEPKIIRLPKPFVCASALRSINYFGLNSQSRLHSCVSPDFIGGKMMAVRAEIAGCRLSWEIPSNIPLSNLSRNETIDLLAVVPSQMIHILDNIKNMPGIRAIIIGGAPISAVLCERIVASGLNAYETYGMTETSSHIALRKVGEKWFSALEGIEVGLDDRECLTIQFDSGELFMTNDLAVLDSHKRFKIEGRFDNIIITGGKKVNPIEVENKLASLISSPFMITSKPDYKWGERVVLRIERANLCQGKMTGHKQESGSLYKLLRDNLKPHEVPKEIEWVDNLPRTPNGKLKR